MTQVKIKITVVAETTVNLAEGETVEQVKDRLADIYLHDAGEKGYINKVDVGGDSKIEIIE